MGLSGLWAVIGAALLTVFLLIFLRRDQPGLATLLSLGFSALLLISILPAAGQLLHLFGDVSSQAGVSPSYLQILFKAIAVTYLTAFAADMSRDAGEKAIAAGVELAGKVMILTLAAPVLVAITEQLLQLLR